MVRALTVLYLAAGSDFFVQLLPARRNLPGSLFPQLRQSLRYVLLQSLVRFFATREPFVGPRLFFADGPARLFAHTAHFRLFLPDLREFLPKPR
jgi:hypothetical protein